MLTDPKLRSQVDASGISFGRVARDFGVLKELRSLNPTNRRWICLARMQWSGGLRRRKWKK